MSDKLPMTREQIAEELLKCFPPLDKPNYVVVYELVAVVEHVLRIGTTALREENKQLMINLSSKGCDDIFCEEAKCSCDKCQVRYPDKMRAIKKEDADNFFFSVPF